MNIKSLFIFALGILCGPISQVNAQNQTPTVSPIESGAALPFDVVIEVADFSLPNGLQSFVSAQYKGQWVFLCGRTNGMHGFDNDPINLNFPPQKQNTVVYVVDPETKEIFSKSLTDPSSGLTQQQIDLLSVTSPQFYQKNKTLYITGGYGFDSIAATFSTKPYLTAVDIPGLIHWVVCESDGETAAQHIRQLQNPIFQVTGGYMDKGKDGLTLLIFGQNFTGYYTDGANGDYSQQVRRFKIRDNGRKLGVSIKNSQPGLQDPNYRRRDLNVVPIVDNSHGHAKPAYMAFSGVFTLAGGAWTVPVLISDKGIPSMADPNDPSTFKQGMNNYASANMGLYSKKTKNMYVIFFGGISYEFFQNGSFQSDSELPFINQVTTIQIDKQGNLTQYLMDNQYPVILSTASNPGNQLLFGAGAQFMPSSNMPFWKNEIFKLDHLHKKPMLVGYIVGGIQSTVPNTNFPTDSAASPYIFTVTLVPK